MAINKKLFLKWESKKGSAEMKLKSKKIMGLVAAAGMLSTTACEKSDRSFSLLSTGSTFSQSPGSYETRKVDILWVIDNSGSMQSSQTNLTNNFQSFISKFQDKNLDFNMAVTTTDAWRERVLKSTAGGVVPTKNELTSASMIRSARKGALDVSSSPYRWVTNSGVNIMNSLTPNLISTFVTNATQGVNGSGDERAFESIKAFLDAPENASFRRNGAYLSIIIVSDEDDFSAYQSQVNLTSPGYALRIWDDYDAESTNIAADPLVLPPSSDTRNIYNLYRDSRLDSVQYYKNYLDAKLLSADNYTVNVIGVLDSQCRFDLNTDGYGGRRIGRRMIQLADLTKGDKGSLCDNFATILDKLANKTIAASSTFFLDKQPDPSTISVIVNGVTVANDATNGWTYDNSNFSVTFHGSSIPAAGASIKINFTPLRASN